MKFGIHYGYWARDWNDDCIPLCEKARSNGFEILEIGGKVLSTMSDPDLLVLGRAAKTEHIELTGGLGLPSDKNIASLDPKIRAAGLEYLKTSILAAEKAGIHMLAGILYASWFYDAAKPVHKHETMAYSVENMKIAADFACAHGVDLMMEVCNRFATYMLNTAQEAVDYTEQVDRKNVHIMLDTFHMNIEEDSFTEAIHTAGNRLGYLHVCESNRKVPGQGRLPWREIMGTLGDIGYQGPVVIESFVTQKGEIGHDLKTWRELRADDSKEGKDREARISLSYLKSFNRD